MYWKDSKAGNVFKAVEKRSLSFTESFPKCSHVFQKTAGFLKFNMIKVFILLY